MTTDNLTTDRPNATTDWADAIHSYEQKLAAFEREDERFKAATAVWEASPKDAADNDAYTAAEKPWEAALDRLSVARTTLVQTPAPDAAAMRYKLEVLADYTTECDEQDAPAIRSLRDDAKRLFAELA